MAWAGVTCASVALLMLRYELGGLGVNCLLGSTLALEKGSVINSTADPPHEYRHQAPKCL
jgi:hypothetical protein